MADNYSSFLLILGYQPISTRKESFHHLRGLTGPLLPFMKSLTIRTIFIWYHTSYVIGSIPACGFSLILLLVESHTVVYYPSFLRGQFFFSLLFSFRYSFLLFPGSVVLEVSVHVSAA
jgi:hypothetical protein